MKHIIVLFFLIITQSYANNFSFKELEAMPKSIAKDYYTWRFLQERNTTKEEALKAYEWTKRKSPKLKKAIRKKVGYLPQ
jgi:soluble lytic murein transglycosylase